MATPRDILVAPGVGNYVITMNNSTDAVKPGHIVTTTGETADTNNVAWPDAGNDICLGVVGCAPGHDIDTAYSVGDMMPVYIFGHSAEVWVRVKTSAGAIKRGLELMHDGGTAVNGLAILGTELIFEHLGYATMESPDVAAERWCKVVLS
jgi:hypothetical protein